MTLPAGVPSSTFFVEQLPEKTKKGDRHKTKGHRHHLCPCDVCGEAMLTDSPGKACKMTPGCEGKHRRPPAEAAA